MKNIFLALLTIFVMIGTFTFAQSTNIRGLYLKGINTWLGNTTTENDILNYCQGNGYNYITFYDLGSLNWSSTTVKNSLASFMSRARANYGVSQFGASGEIYSFFINYIIPYNNSRTAANEKFDVLNYEFEFWNQASISSLYCSRYLTPNGYSCDTAGAYAFSFKEFKRMDSLAAATGLICEIYLGWPTKGQMQAVCARADRVLMHAYRTTDVDLYAYSRGRLIDAASLNTSIKIIPIFSSESSFMGPWLATHPITQPYQTYCANYTAETSSFKQYINLQGYTWFHYTYMPKTTIATASITASGPTTFCTGGSVTLTANSGSSYLWSPGGQTTQSITVSAAGSYSVKVTNSAGVQATSTPVVVAITTTGATPTVTASGPTSFCPGGSVTLTATSAGSYLWSNGATTQSITVSTTGNYSVTTTTGGCSGTSAVTAVNANSAPTTPTITASSSLNICPGKILTLQSSAANGYLWSTGATTRSIAVTTAGTYWVKAYSGPNCSAQSTNQVVTVLTAPTTPSISANGSLSLTSSHTSVVLTSTTANSYAWTDGSTTRAITVTTQGAYRVTVTGSNGCQATSTAAIVSANGCTPPAVPTITLSGSAVIATGQTVTLTSSTAGGYLWSTGATTKSITVSAGGTYTVRAYNAGGCFSTSLPVTIYAVAARTAGHESTETDVASLIAYPNPASEMVNFDFNGKADEEYLLTITDPQGRIIRESRGVASEGLNHTEFSLDGLSSGIYFGYLIHGDMKETVRLVIE